MPSLPILVAVIAGAVLPLQAAINARLARVVCGPIWAATVSGLTLTLAGAGRGGETWAVIASLVETCKLNGVNPQAYLSDVISRIVGGHLQGRLDELLPWAYPTILRLKAAA